MTSQQHAFSVRLFYSYCHKDQKYRESMEKHLVLLKRNNLLKSWSDQNILPGQQISTTIRKKMDEADIMVFLLSQDFIASEECMKEWEYAKLLSGKRKLFFRIPIILNHCTWQDMLVDDDIMALPTDGSPVSMFEKADIAWNQVYEGIKDVAEQLKRTFSPKTEFLEVMQQTEFASQEHIKLQDLYVFSRLSGYTFRTENGRSLEETITNEEQLLKKDRLFIHGEERSGKTTLGRHLFLSLIEKSEPVLHINLEQVSGKSKEAIFIDNYQHQFNGDYFLWKKQDNKTLILDNLSSAPHLIDFVVFAEDYFDRIFVTLSTDVFISYFMDEKRFADFLTMEIECLSHRQQEKFIRKRLELSSDLGEPVTDGLVDQVEKHVNSVMTNKIVPRYPFYVLSILQTLEGFMPKKLSITSYGHCYHVLILANLGKAGISKRDDDINTCFNFAEHLAYKTYQLATEKHTMDASCFDKFVTEYKDRFIISDAILNRLKDSHYGIINKDGHFKTSYMRYFFMGRYLSRYKKEHQALIEQMCKKSHVDSNYLTLIFIIHHTSDDEIIEEILLRTMCILDTVSPAVLNHKETRRFRDIVNYLPKTILSSDSVTTERGKERDIRDLGDHKVETESEIEQTEGENPINDCYKILRNNRILEQVLRNKHGTLKKERVLEIIEVIADSGLRLVNWFIEDEKDIAKCARYIHKKDPKLELDKIKNTLQLVSFVWTRVNLDRIAEAITLPEISDVVNDLVQRHSTPAYDLIGYFSQLGSSKKLTDNLRDTLSELLKKHNDPFLRGVLSLKTQHYMNTHRSGVSIEQSVCSRLGIKYTSRRTDAS